MGAEWSKPFAVVLGLGLQIAPGQIDADRVSEYVLQGFIHCRASAGLTDRNDQFGLVVKILGHAGIRNFACAADRVGGLGEEARRFASRGAHLAGMFGVVLADAVNTVNRKPGLLARDRHECTGRRFKRPLAECCVILAHPSLRMPTAFRIRARNGVAKARAFRAPSTRTASICSGSATSAS